MTEIQIVGRGGQGAVLASQLLAEAFFAGGRWVQAFPSFGPERRGAPVAAFVRVSDRPIHRRCAVRAPEWVIAFEAELLPAGPSGTAAESAPSIVANLPEGAAPPACSGRLFVVDATAVAREQGLRGSSFPLVNTAMVGAFVGASRLLGLAELAAAIRRLAGKTAEANEAAAREAFARVRKVRP